MSNMAYCRFQNTAKDLQDCYANFEETDSEEEAQAKNRLLNLCIDIALEYGGNIGRDVEEVR